MYLNIADNQLNEIVAQSVRETLMSMGLLNEMAIPRKEYVTRAFNQSNIALIHLGKVCAFENDPILSHYKSHWLGEVASQIYDIAKIRVAKDNADSSKSKRAFVEGFIEYRLGKDFDEYDNNMCGYILEALYSEGLGDNEVRKYDTHKIAQDNKERIMNFLLSFVPLLSIKSNTELLFAIKKQAQAF